MYLFFGALTFILAIVYTPWLFILTIVIAILYINNNKCFNDTSDYSFNDVPDIDFSLD